MAIKAQKDEQATLQQINDWLIQNFLFFRGEYIGWKNSVRHNLSLNDCFVKVIFRIKFTTSPKNRFCIFEMSKKIGVIRIGSVSGLKIVITWTIFCLFQKIERNHADSGDTKIVV